MRTSALGILIGACAFSALQSCGFIGMTGESPPYTTKPCPDGCGIYDNFSAQTLSHSGYFRDPVYAAKVERVRYGGSKDTVLRLSGGLSWGARISAKLGFNRHDTGGISDTLSFLAYDSDRKGTRIPDSAISWTDGGPTATRNGYVSATVTLGFRGTSRISATIGTGKGKSESYRELVARDPYWLGNTPMPEAEAAALLAPFAGEWGLVARNRYCGTARGDTLVYSDTATTWAGTAGLPHRTLTVSGLAALAGSQDTPERDSVFFFTGGRFRSRDPFVEGAAGIPPGRWDIGVSWSGSASVFVLTRMAGIENSTCGTDWVFARGAALDSLAAGMP